MNDDLKISFFSLSHQGRIRKNNEDYTTHFIPALPKDLEKSGQLFIVADGVGGAAKGEVASKFASDSVLFEYFQNSELPPTKRLEDAIRNANRDIFQYSQQKGSFQRMATTLVAAVILQNTLIFANVGDSRLYILRDGSLKQLSRDHSLVEEMVRDGAMTSEEARNSKIKNRITRSVGGDAEVHVDISKPIPLKIGDRLLLCSDGLTRYIDGAELEEELKKGKPEAVVKEFIKRANARGGVDNITVALIDILKPGREAIVKPQKPQEFPEKSDLEMIETEYGDLGKSKHRIHLKIAIIAVGIIGLVLLVFLAFIFLSNFINGRNGKATATPQSTQTMQGAMQETPPDATFLQEYQNTPAAQIMTDIKETSEGAVFPVEPPKSNSEWECVYRVRKDDTFYEILKDFNLHWEDKTKVFYYTNCTEPGSSVQCTPESKTENRNPERLEPDQWLILYSSQNEENPRWEQDKCNNTTNGGRQGFVNIIE